MMHPTSKITISSAALAPSIECVSVTTEAAAIAITSAEANVVDVEEEEITSRAATETEAATTTSTRTAGVVGTISKQDRAEVVLQVMRDAALDLCTRSTKGREVVRSLPT